MSAAGVDTASPPGWSGAAPGGPTGTLAAQVARGIEAEVLRRGWPVGASLGSEPRLRERFGVSRAVLREAVRLVEHHQVARMRRGPERRAVRHRPGRRARHRRHRHLPGVRRHRRRRARARPLAGRAAGRRARRGSGRRGRRRPGPGPARRRARNAPPAAGAGDPLHVLLAELSGNPVLELFVDVLTRLTTRYAHTVGSRPAGPREPGRRCGGAPRWSTRSPTATARAPPP